VTLEFKESAISAIAEYAYSCNATDENIGARRLHTVLENLLSDIAFNAGGGDAPQITVSVDAAYVESQLQARKEKDLKKYIL